MNKIKITKTQRDQLIGVAVGTAGLMAVLWFLGITPKQDELAKTEANTAQMQKKLKDAESIMKTTDEVAERLETRRQLLEKQESMLAPEKEGYTWMLETMTDILKNRKGVNIFKFNTPEITDAGIFPGFEYKWAIFHGIGGTGYYHDLGKFFADIENNYPYFRVQNLSLTASGTAGVEPDKLDVTFDLVVPVRSSDAK